MHKLLSYIIAVMLMLLMGATVSVQAANLDGHMQYRVVTYSLSSDVSAGEDSNVNLGPLLITGATSDVITDNINSSPDFGAADPKSATDIFAVSADYLATPDLSLHGAFGITKNRWDSSLDPAYEGSWEANVGIIYRLFNNIRYEVHFGYMETGDLFKESDAYNDVESIIMISNKLTMSF